MDTKIQRSYVKHYNLLTLKGKARRLRKMAIKALQDFDLDVKAVRLVSNEQNSIFRVDTHDKQKFILRVCIPDAGHSLDHINSEMMFLNYLSQQTLLSTPIPIKTKLGKWVTTVATDDIPQPRHCVVFSWVNGVDLADRRSPATWEKFGALSATLHKLAENYTPPKDFDILTYDNVFPFNEDCVLFDDANKQHFSAEEFSVIQDAVNRVETEIRDLYREASGLRVTHGDLHQWNVRIARGKLSPIDFEDIMWAYPIQDIATTLYYNRFEENYDALFSSFKSGYSSITEFPEQYEGEVETHMLARRFNLLNYIFSAEELEITQFPNFIPLTMQRINWVQENVWSKQKEL